MDEYITNHGGLEKMEKDAEYLWKRLEIERMYDLKSKTVRPRRLIENEKTSTHIENN